MNDYKRKIKTKEELYQIIGPRPRPNSVIMCHGTFDLVHPGHIRHLMYAKSRADILIVSLTGDAFVDKANYRPFVPAELRAMNLAALEVVDYVLTDDHPTPEDNIKLLEPDYFAKGYEYSDGSHIKNQIERDAVESYHGEMIYTPGDIQYSSSNIIDVSPPKLSNEKLITLMEANNISFDDLRYVLRDMSDVTVHVVGDTIIDNYIYCNPISSGMGKTPTISVIYDREEIFIGGAAIVSRHLHSAGARVEFSTVTGRSIAIKQSGITVNIIKDEGRIDTIKKVFIANGYRLLKVDEVDSRPISDTILNKFLRLISTSHSDVLIFSDYRHGIFNKYTIPKLIDAIPQSCLKVVDSQVASRWGNILEFKGFDLITPNEREARFALADQDSVIRPLALELYKQAECENLILKLGDKGILTYLAPSDSPGSFFSIDSFANSVVDSIGAGDALLAYSALALKVSDPIIASILGSMAAGVACESEGNNPVTPDEITLKLETVERSL